MRRETSTRYPALATRNFSFPMNPFDTAAILLTLAAAFGYLNYRYIKLPTAIGIMLLSLLTSLAMIIYGQFSPSTVEWAKKFVEQVEFDDTVLNIMLSYLLFAGALHVNLGDLVSQRKVIAILATVGVCVSTFLVGTATYYLLPMFGITGISYIYCLLFGALISPTDPVAVLGILKKIGAPKSLETKICGESLFNDGVGVVIFIAILGIAKGDIEPTFAPIAKLFLKEAVGGVVFGLGLGAIGFYLLKRVNCYPVEILITLAMVTGGYSLAMHLHTSGPLAMVVAGLMIGNHGRTLAMSKETEEHLDTFWELIDEILNALLFLLIGLELLALDFRTSYLLLGLLAIPMVLLMRMISASIPVIILRRKREFSPRVIRILTWGGLRGGISVALVLSLDPSIQRDVFLTMTYMVVIFSIAVQGLTLKHLIKPAGETATTEKS
ncbi:MAG: CPA1 family monovalent cation:H+ antiporter [Verrucomicrobiales bacterium]|jgi:CPA1 family monovalent cation:H+ antiporter